ncbi:MAG: metallopeptidase family protein [Verrucomicrobiota bacterium]
MSPAHLEDIAAAVIEKTLLRLPEAIRTAAEACLIETVLMAEAVRQEPDLEEDTLGLFEGQSHEAGEFASGPQDLPRIRLFLDNIWDYADQDRETFREEVRVTLLHELGHYLGLDEDRVEELGLG